MKHIFFLDLMRRAGARPSVPAAPAEAGAARGNFFPHREPSTPIGSLASALHGLRHWFQAGSPMSPEAQSTLHEIVTIARDGREFYEYAEMVVADAGLRERFSRLAQAKSDVVALVGSRLHAVDELPSSRREFHLGVRASLTRLRSLLATDNSTALLDGLGELEERLIYHYTWVLAGSGDEATRRELSNLLPVLQRCRDELTGASAWVGGYGSPGQNEGPASADPSVTKERRT